MLQLSYKNYKNKMTYLYLISQKISMVQTKVKEE
jgi:hypothetical protein